MKIIINSNTNIYFASFYIKGLIELFGEKSIVFDSKPFKELKNSDEA